MYYTCGRSQTTTKYEWNALLIYINYNCYYETEILFFFQNILQEMLKQSRHISKHKRAMAWRHAFVYISHQSENQHFSVSRICIVFYLPSQPHELIRKDVWYTEMTNVSCKYTENTLEFFFIAFNILFIIFKIMNQSIWIYMTTSNEEW